MHCIFIVDSDQRRHIEPYIYLFSDVAVQYAPIRSYWWTQHWMWMNFIWCLFLVAIYGGRLFITAAKRRTREIFLSEKLLCGQKSFSSSIGEDNEKTTNLPRCCSRVAILLSMEECLIEIMEKEYGTRFETTWSAVWILFFNIGISGRIIIIFST